MPISSTKYPELKNWLVMVVVGVMLTSSSCDKEDSGPAQSDLARCAHIDRDAELGEYLYDVCLRNPWPISLPPATQSRQCTFGGIINDTLLFVACSPRAFPHETATCRTIYDVHGFESAYRSLRAGFGFGFKRW